MKIIPVCLFLVLTAFQCSHFRGEPDGGPCSYNHTYLPAQVYEIWEAGENTVEVTFLVTRDFSGIAPPDTISYYMSKGGYLLKSEADSLGVKKGARFTWEIMEITSGACNPYMEELRMEPYDKHKPK